MGFRRRESSKRRKFKLPNNWKWGNLWGWVAGSQTTATHERHVTNPRPSFPGQVTQTACRASALHLEDHSEEALLPYNPSHQNVAAWSSAWAFAFRGVRDAIIASDDNKVGVPNAYFMLPPSITAKPLEPREGRVWKLRKEGVSSYEHLGFHHLWNRQLEFSGEAGRARWQYSHCFEWKGWREKKKKIKIFLWRLVLTGQWAPLLNSARAKHWPRKSGSVDSGRNRVSLSCSSHLSFNPFVDVGVLDWREKKSWGRVWQKGMALPRLPLRRLCGVRHQELRCLRGPSSRAVIPLTIHPQLAHISQLPQLSQLRLTHGTAAQPDTAKIDKQKALGKQLREEWSTYSQ